MSPAATSCSAAHAVSASPAEAAQSSPERRALRAAGDRVTGVDAPRPSRAAGVAPAPRIAPSWAPPPPPRCRGWELSRRLGTDLLALSHAALAGRSLRAGQPLVAACLVGAAVGLEVAGACVLAPRGRGSNAARGEARALTTLTAAGSFLFISCRVGSALECLVSLIYAAGMLAPAVTFRYRASCDASAPPLAPPAQGAHPQRTQPLA